MRGRVIVAVMVLAAGACGDDGGGATTTQPPATTTSAPADTTTTAVVAAVWERIPADQRIFGGTGDDVMAAVVAGGPGFIAVGSDYEGGNGSDGGEISDGDGAVWTSVYGRTWTRVEHDEGIFGGDSYQEIQDVIAFGSSFIAVGVDHDGVDTDAAVWTSPDGVTWTRVVAGETVFGGPGDQAMLRIDAVGPGLVAVGFEDVTQEFDWDAAVWTSTDGTTWSRLPHDEAVFGGANNQVMWGVGTAGDSLVAVGIDASAGNVNAAVWTSTDGTVWTRLPHDDGLFGGAGAQRMADIVTFAGGVIVVGSDGVGDERDAAVWTSADGVTWTRVVAGEVFGGAGSQEMFGVVAGDSGLVAVGADNSSGDADGAIWTSPDGLTWTRIADPDAVFGGTGDQRLGKAAFGAGTLVAVGSDGFGGDLDAAVWILGG